MSEENETKPMLDKDFVTFLESDIAKAIEEGLDTEGMAFKAEVILTLDDDGKLVVQSQEITSGEIVKGD